MQIPNGKIFHEPLSIPYCFGPEKHKRYKDRNLEPSRQEYVDVTYQDIIKKLTDKSYDKQYDYMFSKDFPLYVTEYRNHNNNLYYEYLLKQDLRYPLFRHTFLIRHPLKVLISLYKVHLKLGKGYDTFVIDYLGFNELLLLYNKCVELGFEKLLIIDADDLVRQPKFILQEY
eukprot:UN30781